MLSPLLTWDRKNQGLRNALHLDGIPLGEHAIRIAELRRLHHHTIVRIDGEAPPFVFCLPYALKLCVSLTRVINKTYKELIIGKNLWFVGIPFADWLVRRLTPIDRPEPGCLVFYFRSKQWAHAGRFVRCGAVVSKWGMFPAYEHGMWEIPLSYGDEVRCYQMPGEHEVVRLFLEFGVEVGLKAKLGTGWASEELVRSASVMAPAPVRFLHATCQHGAVPCRPAPGAPGGRSLRNGGVQ